MKIAKFVFFFVSVLLAGILAGCVNPIVPVPAVQEQAQQAQAPGDGSLGFTVTLAVGENGEARSILGGVTGYLAAWNTYIINIGQLVVVDKSSGKIIYCAKQERTADNDGGMNFNIEDIPFGAEYIFMLLMGHKERTNYAATTGYTYSYKAPTLLLAGTATKQINGPEKVSIEMWPLVVDTKFVANEGNASTELTVEPETAGNNPGVVLIPPTTTKVIWNVVQGTNKVNGFKNLFEANKLFPGDDGNFKMVTAGRTIVKGPGINSGNAHRVEMNTNSLALAAANAQLTNVGTVSLDISDYTKGTEPLKRIGREGSVNFELDYVPFGPDLWTAKYKNDFQSNPIPEWIIRNGINSEPQDSKTIFVVPSAAKDTTSLTWGSGGANGNGAIRFKPTNGTGDDPGNGSGDNPATGGGGSGSVIPGLGALAISKATYKGVAAGQPAKAKIDFTIAGTEADVYYVSAASKPTDISTYKPLGTKAAGSYTDVVIDKPGDGENIYMLIYKDGKIAYLTIKTSGSATVGVTYNPGNLPPAP
ncbi:MAG: hypothetical protein LBL19_03700 [Spirochaetaceae bacterium]|nr:hypothetical protein [Spirochaetaceae bacterium]